MTYGERCGANGAGQSVWVENVSRDRVVLRETWLSERGEKRSRDHSIAAGEKRGVGCTIGDIPIEFHYFKFVP
jgi:hypothetical protein